VLVGEAPPVAPRRWVFWVVGVLVLLGLAGFAASLHRRPE